MAGLNLEFHPDSYSLFSESAKHSEGKGDYFERIYEVPFGGAGSLYVQTENIANSHMTECFTGLFQDPRDPLSVVGLGGYIGAHQRSDGVLSIGTPYRAASELLMNFGKSAAEANNCFLRVDKDDHNELESQMREKIYGELLSIVDEHGVGIYEEADTLFLVGHAEDTFSTSRSLRILRYMEEAHQKAVMPGDSKGSEPLLAGTAIEMDYAYIFRQHFLKTVRGSGDFLQLAAETALGRWNAAVGNHNGGPIELNPDI